MFQFEIKQEKTNILEDDICICNFLKKKKKKVTFYKFIFYYLYFTILLFLKYNTVLRSIVRFFKTDNRKINGSVILSTHKEVFVILIAW